MSPQGSRKPSLGEIRGQRPPPEPRYRPIPRRIAEGRIRALEDLSEIIVADIVESINTMVASGATPHDAGVTVVAWWGKTWFAETVAAGAMRWELENWSVSELLELGEEGP